MTLAEYYSKNRVGKFGKLDSSSGFNQTMKAKGRKSLQNTFSGHEDNSRTTEGDKVEPKSMT